MRRLRRARSGFSLLEVMFAMAVLMVSLVGALAGLIASAQQFHDGQIRQSKMVLLEAKSQRLILADHSTSSIPFAGGTSTASGTWPVPISSPSTVPESQPIGAAPWFLDPTPAVCPTCTLDGGTDLGTGAFFNVDPQGNITPVTVTGASNCSQAPSGVFCREVLIATGLEASGTNSALPPSSVPYTVWIRVSKGGEPPNKAVVQRDVVVQ